MKYPVVVLSDIHMPYEDGSALELMRLVVRDVRPRTVILNGDIVDFVGISRYDVHPLRRAGFSGEVRDDGRRIKALREIAPRARWIYLEGNHEYRLQRYLWSKAPEISDMLTVPTVLELEGIEYIGQRQEIQGWGTAVGPEVRIGRIVVMHGHTVRLAGSTVNVARSVFQRLLCSALIGHWHRSSVYAQSDHYGEFRGVWVLGCLCKPRPHWDVGRIWGQGFAVIDAVAGEPEVELVNFAYRGTALVTSWRGRRYEVAVDLEPWYNRG